MLPSVKSKMSSKLGHMGSKIRSLGQIMKTTIFHSRNHIGSDLQHTCLEYSFGGIQNLGNVRSQTGSLGKIQKTFLTL